MSGVNYTLHINFDGPQGVATLNQAQQSICIIKPVASTVANSDVCWIAFSPFQSNTIQWTETYGVYASSVSVQNGAEIDRLSDAPAALGNRIPFSNGVFGTPAPGAASGSFGINNQWPNNPMLTFGLTQRATVNGTSIDSELNAALVPFNNTADFTPSTTLKIFAEAQMKSGAVATIVQNTPITVIFSPTNTTHTVQYQSSTNTFVLVS